jgi:hypothetical protein
MTRGHACTYNSHNDLASLSVMSKQTTSPAQTLGDKLNLTPLSINPEVIVDKRVGQNGFVVETMAFRNRHRHLAAAIGQITGCPLDRTQSRARNRGEDDASRRTAALPGYVLPLSCSKNTPGERCSTITRSVPLMMKGALPVIKGTSYVNSCSLTSLTTLFCGSTIPDHDYPVALWHAAETDDQTTSGTRAHRSRVCGVVLKVFHLNKTVVAQLEGSLKGGRPSAVRFFYDISLKKCGIGILLHLQQVGVSERCRDCQNFTNPLAFGVW